MHPSHSSTSGDRIFDAGPLRTMLAFMLAGVLSWLVTSATFAEPLIPAADSGGSGSGNAPTASEMLRGAYSPIDAAPEIAVTKVQTVLTVDEMLRGDLSPIPLDAV
jgi:hypothetical protein